MTQVMPGRYTAQADEPFVVFLIGMRINKLFALRRWAQALMAMPPMLRALQTDPAHGYLGGEFIFYWRGIGLIQYWRSFEDLEAYARNPAEAHVPAWRRFNQSVGADGSVGIWHETYMVEPGKFETMYGNMPVFGLAKALQHVPAVGQRETARRRLGGDNEPAVESPAAPEGVA
jgi:hypothetical protein